MLHGAAVVVWLMLQRLQTIMSHVKCFVLNVSLMFLLPFWCFTHVSHFTKFQSHKAPITSDKTVFCFHSCTFQQRKFPWKYLFSHEVHPQMILVFYLMIYSLLTFLCDVSFGLSCNSGHCNIVISHCTIPRLSFAACQNICITLQHFSEHKSA